MNINEIKVELPNSAQVSFQAMIGQEGLSELFEYVVEVWGTEHWLDAPALLGKAMAVAMPYAAGGERHFHGYIARVEHAGRQGRHYVDRLTMRPWLWFLEHHVDCKVFQKKSVPDIVKEVLRGHSVAVRHFGQRGTYPEIEYCIQYNESDRVFIDRLLESAGMYYYFKHSANEHQMVLCDAESTHAASPHYHDVPFIPHGHRNRVTAEFIDALTLGARVQPGAAAFGDYNFETPRVNLKVDHKRRAGHAQGEHEVFEWPGGYGTPSAGRSLAGKRSGSFGTEAKRYFGSGTARGIAVGHTVTIEHPPAFVATGQSSLLVVSTTLKIQQPPKEQEREDNDLLRCDFTAVPASGGYHPLRKTPRPVMPAAQSAVVVGPSGSEFHTDKYGRVKLQFHWDRVGASNENSSCFVRVAQPLAGSGFGLLALPRVGQEVLVTFLDGDPDRPLVIGRLANADQMPPYPLPDNATVSTFKSRSSPHGESGNYNELRFQDKKGEEHVWLQAEKDFHRRVESVSSDQIGSDHLAHIKGDVKERYEKTWHMTVDSDVMHKVGGDFHLQSATDMLVKAGSQYSLKSGKDLTAEGGMTLSLKSGTDMHQKAGTNLNAEAGVNLHIKAGVNLVIEAAEMITLKAGGSCITIAPDTINIFAPQVNINSAAMPGQGPGANPVATSDPKEPTAPEIPEDPLSSSGGAAPMPQSPVPTNRLTTPTAPGHLGGRGGHLKAAKSSTSLRPDALLAGGYSAGMAAAKAVEEGKIPLTREQLLKALEKEGLQQAGDFGLDSGVKKTVDDVGQIVKDPKAGGQKLGEDIGNAAAGGAVDRIARTDVALDDVLKPEESQASGGGGQAGSDLVAAGKDPNKLVEGSSGSDAGAAGGSNDTGTPDTMAAAEGKPFLPDGKV